MSVTAIKIPTLPDNPYPLGRNIEHDSRSRGFPFSAAAIPAAQWKDKQWVSYVPILDQSDLLAQGIKLAGNPDALSSCTGNTAVACIGSKPLWFKQAPSWRRDVKDAAHAEIRAIDLYASATELDEFPDTYPPTDSGSSGLGVAKAAQRLGLISGYDHIFDGVNGVCTALQVGPVLLGTNWYESMFNVSTDGLFTISGAVAGGHEYLLDALYLELKLFRMRNSWTSAWGDGGCGFLTFDQVDRLLGEQGDAMTFRV